MHSIHIFYSSSHHHKTISPSLPPPLLPVIIPSIILFFFQQSKMAKHLSLTSATPKAPVCLCLFLLAITLGHATSARILNELDNSKPIPAVIEPVPSSDDDLDISSPPVPSPYVGVGPVESNLIPTPDAANVAHVAGPAPGAVAATGSSTIPPTSVVGSTATIPVGTGATEANTDNHSHPSLSFFMHDILGGSSPSAMVVPGTVASSGVRGNNDDLNNNNLPHTEEHGETSITNIQNNGNNNVVNGGDNLPFVSGGKLPAGATLQKPIFGSITVIDEELTEGHELGSSVLGKAQGFYLASSLDGSSQTMAVTILFHGVGEHNEEEDTISFFGVHRAAALESQIAIVGGTGKYENAKGYATIQTQHQVDQHTTDGEASTLLQFNVYLSV